MLRAGDRAPSFTLAPVDGGGAVTDPWAAAPGGASTVVAFFKVSCPVCKMVAPILTRLADAGVSVIAVGEDPPGAITLFNETEGQRVPALSEPAPYAVSDAYGLEAVPTIFSIGPDGVIRQAIAGWSRDAWNELAAELGVAEPLSTPDDGLRPYRPG